MSGIPHIKNLYDDVWKQNYGDLRLFSKATETPGMASSNDFIAVPHELGGGSILAIMHIKDVKRNPKIIKFKGHSGSIQDMNFSPFYSSIVSTASEDTTVRLWDIPPEMSEKDEVKDSIVVLSGHTKKAMFCTFNPAVDFLIATASFDSTVKIWDTNMAETKFSVKLEDSATSLHWNFNGSFLAACTRGKDLNVFDPRTSSSGISVKCHEGGKSMKLSWLDGYAGGETILLTTGFSKTNSREVKLWDTRNFSQSTNIIDLDRSSQALYPQYDEATGVVYLAGKGDGNVRMYQFSHGTLNRIGEYRSNIPTKYFTFIPKVICDTKKCEIGRFLKCENSKSIIPISFVVPRKNTTVLQEDLFPPIPTLEPSLEIAMWMSGENAEIKRLPHIEVSEAAQNLQIQPENKLQRKATTVVTSRAVQRKKTLQITQDMDKLQISLDEALERVEELEKENEELKKAVAKKSPTSSPNSNEKVLELTKKLEDSEKRYHELSQVVNKANMNESSILDFKELSDFYLELTQDI